MRHRVATMVTFVLMLVLDRSSSSSSCPRASSRTRTPRRSPITTEAAQGTAYGKLVEYQDQVANIIRRDPNVEGLVSTIGGSASQTLGGPNLGQIVVTLKPRDERALSVDEVMEELRPQVDKVAGMHVFMQNPPTVRIGAQVSKSLYQFSMQSPDKPALYAAARKLQSALAALPGLQDVTSDLEVTQPAGRRRDRSRQGRGARRHRQPDRKRVLRRVRPAVGLDHLRVGQRVQGAARAGAAVPAGSERAVDALLQGQRGRPVRWFRSTRWRR